MFKDNTVFIVGAGASCEYGMPSGADLVTRISHGAHVSFGEYDRQPTGDADLRSALRRTYRGDELNKRLPALRQIASGIYLAESIDAYIDRHRNTEHIAEMGKFLIAFYLLKAERASKLSTRRGDDVNLPSLANGWLDPFARILFQGVTKGDERHLGTNIKIICFNYDRCIEQYLQSAIVQAFHIGHSEAAGIVGRMKILRPYGTLGALSENFFAFGDDPETVSLPEIASRLRTYTEQVEDTSLLNAIREAVLEAQQIVFLGFGYHRQNVELLTGRPEGGPGKHFYYSGYGVPEQAIETILERTVMMAGYPRLKSAEGRVHFEREAKAVDVMRVYRMALSA